MNTNSFSNSYKEAGVDVTAGYKAVELMKQHVARTMTSGAISALQRSDIPLVWKLFRPYTLFNIFVVFIMTASQCPFLFLQEYLPCR